MKHGLFALAAAGLVVLALAPFGPGPAGDAAADADAAPAAVLSVALIRAQQSALPLRVPATGHVAAWQEASIGAQADGLRLTEVRVNVGDTVRRGQVLALLDAATVQAELAEARAAVAQAVAEADEAQANHERAKKLGALGAMSAQQVGQYAVGATTARARRDAVRAAEQRQRLRLAHTRVLAPDDGIITARMATVGAVAAAGQELFRLIQDGRLEWRAVVSAADLDTLEPGQVATIERPGHEPVRGQLRMLAPQIDMRTHTGLVYVDLPSASTLRAGLFVGGSIEIGSRAALTLPQSAVLLRDGFHYVLRVDAASRVAAQRVEVGRIAGDRIEISAGLSASEAVVAAGVGFLGEGDRVRVVDAGADSVGAGTAAAGAPAADAVGGHGSSGPRVTGSHAAAPRLRAPPMPAPSRGGA
ncbi:MAG TPA: efflux RND transporter periplasmic adaptor subunit [Dokdonella sp.]|uniref:efflux RND transporter periplasmic adaptor subunit n=1 Tax=Dokdonella sp. TaxID=2291710 RepID=UPI002BED8225|nr:efflux RND transporter periplasmic adaptor subunit [Dokdonella sp.]HUD40899.1 efflux RND transporter periplasmic adaptor subunit [Dokdonella sp.]